MSRAVSVRDIDFSMLGPDSPLRQLTRRAPRRDLEHQEQVKIFDWAREHETVYPELEWLFAVPNWIGVRTAKQGARLKREGRKAGVPDTILPVKRGSFVGLVIEMKAGTNRATKEQRAWLNHFTVQGWRTQVCYSGADAISTIREYLNDAIRNG